MNRPSQGSVESLLSELDTIVTSPDGFELWIPANLTLNSNPIRTDVAMTIVLDKILGMGFQPDGFIESKGGRIYRYKAFEL
jgi:hypothetical protein